MNLLLINLALAFPNLAAAPVQQPAPTQQPGENLPMQKLDGEWSVTYAERDGKKLEPKGFTQVTIKGNLVTCRHEGKEHSWRLEFGPHNMVRCTEQVDGKISTFDASDKRDQTAKGFHTHHGVYIASPEYFCLGLNKGRDHRMIAQPERPGATNSTAQPGAAQPGATQPAQPGGLRFGEQGPHGDHFVVILHRVGSIAPSSR